MINHKRGEIFYIMKNDDQIGSEIFHGRPAVVVSNDRINSSSGVIEVVFLTTQPKRDLPTHVRINSSGKPSTALCEQVTSVSLERVGSYLGITTAAEMAQIDAAIAESLSLDLPSTQQNETQTLVSERDMYMNLYDDLLNRLIEKK